MTIMIPAWVDGALTPVEKLDAHKRGLKHKAVSVFVLHGSAILMQQRALGKYHTPGLWANTCCTHPEWDEAPMDCAIRRLDEEIGLRHVALQHKYHLEYRADVGDGMIEHEVVDVFVGRVDDRPDLTPNPDEVREVAWIAYADLLRMVDENPDHFTPWLRIYLADHATTIFGSEIT